MALASAKPKRTPTSTFEDRINVAERKRAKAKLDELLRPVCVSHGVRNAHVGVILVVEDGVVTCLQTVDSRAQVSDHLIAPVVAP